MCLSAFGFPHQIRTLESDVIQGVKGLGMPKGFWELQWECPCGAEVCYRLTLPVSLG